MFFTSSDYSIEFDKEGRMCMFDRGHGSGRGTRLSLDGAGMALALVLLIGPSVSDQSREAEKGSVPDVIQSETPKVQDVPGPVAVGGNQVNVLCSCRR